MTKKCELCELSVFRLLDVEDIGKKICNSCFTDRLIKCACDRYQVKDTTCKHCNNNLEIQELEENLWELEYEEEEILKVVARLQEVQAKITEVKMKIEEVRDND